jgi:hypothetical protein
MAKSIVLLGDSIFDNAYSGAISHGPPYALIVKPIFDTFALEGIRKPPNLQGILRYGSEKTGFCSAKI